MPDVKVGDSAEATEKALLAAGAKRVLRPTAPFEILSSPPVVAKPGQTNVASTSPSRTVIFTWYFQLNDGRELELLVHGGKITGVKYREK